MSEESPNFTIMTFNVGNGLVKPAPLINLLRASKPDIIGLQELTATQAGAIERNLKEEYPFQVLFGEGIPGKGLLSRYPILEKRQLDHYPHRPDLLGVVEVNNLALRIIIAHPLPPRLHRRGFSFTEKTHHHVAALTLLASTDEPTVLIGDFNMLSRDRRYTGLKNAGLVDVFSEVGLGLGFTLPTRVGRVRTFPFMRVDYIWISRHLAPLRAWVGPHTGSDHLPVLASLALPNI